MFTIKKNRGYL